MLDVNIGVAKRFLGLCQRAGVNAPSAITRAIELDRVAADIAADSANTSVLDLTDEGVRDYIVDHAIRRHQSNADGIGLAPGLDTFRKQLARDLREAALPALDALVEELQPRFEVAAQPFVVAAQQFGFTLATTSDDVINLADENASAAWRAARGAWAGLAPIVTLRIQMNEVFHLPPTPADMDMRERTAIQDVNHSVLFAEGENWSTGRDYLVGRSTSLDWLALAKGGLRLNTPTEVAEKLGTRAAAARRAQFSQGKKQPRRWKRKRSSLPPGSRADRRGADRS